MRQQYESTTSYMKTEWKNVESQCLVYYTVRKWTFNDLKDLEREPLRYCKCDGKVTFTRPFLAKVTFDEQVNVLERYCKGDLSIIFTKP